MCDRVRPVCPEVLSERFLGVPVILAPLHAAACTLGAAMEGHFRKKVIVGEKIRPGRGRLVLSLMDTCQHIRVGGASAPSLLPGEEDQEANSEHELQTLRKMPENLLVVSETCAGLCALH